MNWRERLALDARGLQQVSSKVGSELRAGADAMHQFFDTRMRSGEVFQRDSQRQGQQHDMTQSQNGWQRTR